MLNKYQILTAIYQALLTELSEVPLKECDRFLKVHHQVRTAHDDLYFYSISDKGLVDLKETVQDTFDWSGLDHEG